MSSPSLSRKHSGLGFPLMTTEIGQDHDFTKSKDGMLTPISDNCENRRPSITSSGWSFISQATSVNSHPSSIDSFSREPSTPPSHGVGSEISIVTLDMSQLTGRGRDQFMSSPFHQPETSPAMIMTSKNWWDNQQEAQLSLRQSNFEPDHMIARAPDLSTNHNVGLEQRLELQQPRFPDMPCTWMNSPVIHGVPPVNYCQVTYADGIALHGLSSQVPEPPSWGVLNYNTGADVATIIPTQTMVDIPPTLNREATEAELSSPTAPTIWDRASFYGIKREGDSSDLDYQQSLDYSDHSPVSAYAPMSFSSQPSPKPTKRPKRAVSKRKRLASYVDGGSVEVNDKIGRLKCPVDVSTSGKQQRCPECDGKFQRVEHLRRHIATHNKDGPCHRCPDPDCKRSFNARADNLREHFKTHLRQTPGRRNPVRTFDEFYNFIRQSDDIPPEVGDKYVAKLEDWRSKGGHLKADNGSSRARVRG
jgi:hypothetical protein